MTEENHKIRAGLEAAIWSQDLTNKIHECHHHHDLQWQVTDMPTEQLLIATGQHHNVRVQKRFTRKNDTDCWGLHIRKKDRQNSSVSIATKLRVEWGIVVRLPESAKSSPFHSVQESCGSHSASCPVGTEGYGSHSASCPMDTEGYGSHSGSCPVGTEGYGSHSASCPMDTEGYGSHSASCPISTERYFLNDKVAGAWS
jgi:hypothetical protein